MNGLDLRKIITKKQQQEVVALHKLCLPADTTADWKSADFFAGFYDEKKLIAFAIAKKSAGYSQAMYLSRCCVHPNYRGKGLQKRLIHLREVWALHNSMVYSITDTSNDNVASMNALIACGYRPYWPELVHPWALPNSVYWRKTL
jgi:ribosomal protein S18 acetylase RimI-like enzyme